MDKQTDTLIDTHTPMALTSKVELDIPWPDLHAKVKLCTLPGSFVRVR